MFPKRVIPPVQLKLFWKSALFSEKESIPHARAKSLANTQGSQREGLKNPYADFARIKIWLGARSKALSFETRTRPYPSGQENEPAPEVGGDRV